MPHAARAQDSWSDPPPRRPRRQAADWASPEDLEILSTIGRPREADWSVLTLERDDEAGDAFAADDDAPATVDAAAMARRPMRVVASEPEQSYDVEPDVVAHMQIAPAGPAPLDLPPQRAANGRRTVVIRGQVAERERPYATTAQRHRPSRRPSERVGARPDRVALWAFGLGLLLILVAVLSAAGA